MKDTVKAKNYYRVLKYSESSESVKGKSNKELGVLLLDGDVILFSARLRPMEDFFYEVVEGNNEHAYYHDVFTTRKGNQFIYWEDKKTLEDFLTRVEL